MLCAYTARALSVRSSLQNMAEEELAHHVVGNDSGMYKVVTHHTNKHTHNKTQLHHAGLFPDGIVSFMTPSAPFKKSK